MPTSEYYCGSTANRLRQLADHHYTPRTRHISHYEYTLLCEVADRLSSMPDTEAPSPRGNDEAP